MRKYIPAFLALLLALGISAGAIHAQDADAPADETTDDGGADEGADSE